MKKLCLVIIAMVFISATPAVRAAQPIIAVLDFSGSSVSQSELTLFIDFISSHIVQTGQYTVVDRMQRQALLEEIEFSNSDCTDERCQLEIGRILAANNIVVGSLGKFGDRFILNIKLIEVETGRTDNAASKTYTSLNDLLDDSQALTLQLLRIGTQPAPAVKPPAAEQPSVGASPPSESNVQEKPMLLNTVPIRTIKVDGDYSDWNGLAPAFIDVAGDNNKEFQGTDIKEIYLAKDQKRIYVCFLLFGKGFPAFPAVFMWAQVQVELDKGKYLNLNTYYDDGWKARLEIWNIGNSEPNKTTALAQGKVIRRGNGFEAEYPLSDLYTFIQTGTEYRTIGKVGVPINSQKEERDRTEFRLITF
jgi:TolB-like protein